jgi:hypothetical protein
VVEVTTIREGHEFEDHDYPDECEGIEKLIDGKGGFHSLGPQRYYCQNTFVVDRVTTEHRGWGHSYIKHTEACSKLSSINDSTSHSKP